MLEYGKGRRKLSGTCCGFRTALNPGVQTVSGPGMNYTSDEWLNFLDANVKKEAMLNSVSDIDCCAVKPGESETAKFLIVSS